MSSFWYSNVRTWAFTVSRLSSNFSHVAVSLYHIQLSTISGATFSCSSIFFPETLWDVNETLHVAVGHIFHHKCMRSLPVASYISLEQLSHAIEPAASLYEYVHTPALARDGQHKQPTEIYVLLCFFSTHSSTINITFSQIFVRTMNTSTSWSFSMSL